MDRTGGVCIAPLQEILLIIKTKTGIQRAKRVQETKKDRKKNIKETAKLTTDFGSIKQTVQIFCRKNTSSYSSNTSKIYHA